MVISLSMTALSRGPEGVYALAVTAAPVGYHPSTKYWRTKATAPATTGVDMLVPLSVPSAQFWLLVLLQAHQEQSDALFVVQAAETECKEGSNYRIFEDVLS